ncbi:uncharacterized protein LOC132611354 isoform X1 [Lycium barbarum]|uniref:uncharacterized protein LOC132611354 isoform X1 n=1 Tax=Lycium barbarum TaxID=112863 RepID=UPI00293E6348|nr:uncharacterized protein LOC132611354 isoform X1 [Lycium barbarum]
MQNRRAQQQAMMEEMEDMKQLITALSSNPEAWTRMPGGTLLAPVNGNNVPGRGQNELRNGDAAGSKSAPDDPFRAQVLRFMADITDKMDKTAKEAEKNAKEFHRWMIQIPRAPPVIEGSDAKKYIQLAPKPEAAPELILKRFKMPNIPKYDGTTDPQEHIMAHTMAVKGNDLKVKEIESVLIKNVARC